MRIFHQWQAQRPAQPAGERKRVECNAPEVHAVVTRELKQGWRCFDWDLRDDGRAVLFMFKGEPPPPRRRRRGLQASRDAGKAEDEV